MTAFVRGVMAASTDAPVTLPLRGSTSAHATVAPAWRMAMFVGSAVIAVETTSSPAPTPATASAVCSAAVPLEKERTRSAPTSGANAASKAATGGPSEICPL